jgi:hypothetical protein
VQASCRAIARDRALPVLCPSGLPAGAWIPEPRLGLRLGRCTYLLSIVTRKATQPFHAIFGGQCRALALTVRAGHWPADSRVRDRLGLIGAKPLKPGEHVFPPVFPTLIRRIAVHGHQGLLLVIAPFPNGGVHGGHIAAIWDQGGHGYAISLHFREAVSAPTASEESTVIAAATSMSRSTVRG